MAGRSCNRCGSRKDLCVHHKNRNHYDDRPCNREILCRSCHAKEHWKDRGEELLRQLNSPEVRKRNVASIKSAHLLPESLAKQRNVALAQWVDPDQRKRKVEGMRAAGQLRKGKSLSQEHRRKISEGNKRNWKARKANHGNQ